MSLVGKPIAWVGVGALLTIVLAGCTSEVPSEVDGPSGTITHRARSNSIGYPLAGPAGVGSTFHKNVGDEFTYGLLILFNYGPDPIEILDVEPEIRGDGLTFQGAKIAGLDRTRGAKDLWNRWPPRPSRALGDPVDARGTVVPASQEAADRGVEVLMGYRVTATGRTTVPAVAVRYTVAGDEHEETFVATIAVCAPVDDTKCDPEYGDS